MIKKYNEGIRDKMTPKPTEDIIKSVRGMGGFEQMKSGARYGILDLIKPILDKDIYLPTIMDELFIIACQNGNLNVIEYLMSRDKFKYDDSTYLTGMVISTRNGYDDISSYIEKHRKVNESIRDKMTPRSKEDIIRDFQLKRTEMKTWYKSTPSNDKIKYLFNNLYSIKKILTDEEIVNLFKKVSTSTRLFLGHIYNYPPLIKQALEEGVDSVDLDRNLIMVVDSGDIEALKVYLDSGINSKTIDEMLKRAIKRGDKDEIELLNKYIGGDKTNEGVRDKMTPKSEDEIDIITKERLPKIIDEIADDLMASGDYDEIGLEKVRRMLVKNKDYIVDKISDNYTVNQISAIFYMNKDRLIYESIGNTSLRDKMTPKSREEISNVLNNMTYKEYRNAILTKKHTFKGITFNLGLLLGANIKNKEKYLKKISGGYKTRRLPDEVGQELAKDLYYNWYLAESVRDRMTPRSKGDTKDLLDDIVRILSYTLYKWPTVEWSRAEAHTYVESHRAFVEQWVADNGYSPDRLEVLAGEMINYFGPNINEGVRDMMTPKPEEEIKKGLERKYVGRCFKNKLTFKNEIVRIVDVNYSPAYREWVLQGINVRNNARYGFSPILRFLDEYREVFPKKDKLGRLRYTGVNEGVRAMMTPKSKDDIVMSLKKSGKLTPEAKLEYGVKSGKLSFVKDAIEKDDLDPDWNSGFALRLACIHGHANVVKYLLEMGVDRNRIYINKKKEDKIWTPIKFATSYKHYDVVDLLETYFPNTKLYRMNNKLKSFFRFNESVRTMMTPKSDEDVKSIFPPIVDEVTELLKGKVENFDIGLDQLYSDAYIEIYFEIGKFAYQLEVFRLGELNHRYRLMGATGSNWKTVYVSNASDRMVSYIKGLLSSNESLRDKMTPKSTDDILKTVPKFTELYSDVKHWTKRMADISVSDIDYDTNGTSYYVYFKIYIMDNESAFGDYGRNALMVKCYDDQELFLSLKGRYSSKWESISFRTDFPEVIREMNKLRKGINEGVKDMMTPKSEDDIKRDLDKLSPDRKLNKGINTELPWLVEDALKSGADPNMTYPGSSYPKGFTCLMKVIITNCNLDIIKLLVKYGADVNGKTKNGSSALGILKGQMGAYHNSRYQEAYDFIKSEVDKMNESIRDKMTPRPKTEVDKAKKHIINYIKQIVDVNGGHLTMSKIGVSVDDSPIYEELEAEDGSTVRHIITMLYEYDVKVAQYDDYANRILGLDWYRVEYEDLSPEILMEIKSLLEEAVQWENINGTK